MSQWGRASVEGNTSHIGTTSTASLGSFGLIITIGLRPDAVKPGIHCVRTRWIRGFMAFGQSGACES